MYIQWIVLFCSFGLIFSGWIPERIVGGDKISISSVPWQASLQKNGEHHCGAVIYNNEIVITAAHCVLEENPSSLTVRVGSSLSNSGGQLVKVSRFIAHEDYHWPKDFSHDLAVIRLQRPLRFNKRVNNIPLASSSPAAGTPALVSGWGTIGWRWPTSRSLLSVTLPIVDHFSCWKAYNGNITDDMICAAAPGRDACSGDSGGPLVSNGQLVGIVSFGAECAHPKYPGVYADVAKLRPWILQAINTI
ncbi:trypsin beta-like [Drosophila kikkawai]|uniref:trypsin n=1 Tax=Drosophila kikkawai TaxID=30033 RepID=A0A6P4I1T8_DROKI|nr:trypsin beta-like [Drosophila kikkawai]